MTLIRSWNSESWNSVSEVDRSQIYVSFFSFFVCSDESEFYKFYYLEWILEIAESMVIDSDWLGQSLIVALMGQMRCGGAT